MNESAEFWEKVAISGVPDRCWEWRGTRSPKGYGRAYWMGRSTNAHRTAWELAHDRLIPFGLHVLHRCDNPPCCNPAHLFLGTNDDNSADKVSKGRQWRPLGELAPLAKLTAEQVREIRSARATGEGLRSIAKRFGIRQGNVWHIVTRRTWAHLDEEVPA